MSKVRNTAASAVLACVLASCGTFVPGFGELYDTVMPDALISALIEHVHCEVKGQVEFLILEDLELAPGQNPPGRRLQWLDDWGAQLTLTLTVDEKTTLNPGVTLNKVLPNAVVSFPNGNVTTSQLDSLGLGGGLSADATRKAVVAWFIDFREFTKQKADRPSTKARLAADAATAKGDVKPAKPITNLMKRLTPELAKAKLARERYEQEARAAGTYPPVCPRPGGVQIEGDLKFREWLVMTLREAFVSHGVTGDFAKDLQNEIKAAKKDVLQDQITFVVQYNGSITPSWKLVRVAVNQSGTFLNAQRARTQDLVVTLGPAPVDVDAVAQQKQQNQDLAAAIGVAVANSINGRTP